MFDKIGEENAERIEQLCLKKNVLSFYYHVCIL